MKTKTLLLSIFLLTASFMAKGTEYVVFTSADLLAKVTGAVDGDVIILGQSDSILSQTALAVTKRITVKAASGLASKPQIKVGFLMKDLSSIRIEGIKFFYDKPATPQVNTDSKYGISAVLLSSIDSIKLINCEASNFGRGLIRSDQASPAIATIKEIVIDNCIISNVSSYSNTYATIGLKTAKVSKISITNTTFLNGLSGVIYSEESATPLNFLMDHVTIFNCGKGGNKNIINFKSPVGSTFAVTNSIIYYSGLKAETAATDTLLVKAIDFSATLGGVGSLTLNNSIICPNQFLAKKNLLIAPASTSTSWATYNLVTVDSLSMDANYKVTSYPTQLNTIGDPRGYKAGTGVNTVKNSSLSINVIGSEIMFSETANINIFSVTGQQVKSIQNANLLSVANLPKGIYIVKAGTESKGYKVQKITIK
ncbi:MAG: DUF4957 domain-containing protein [Paludibacter sp.]